MPSIVKLFIHNVNTVTDVTNIKKILKEAGLDQHADIHLGEITFTTSPDPEKLTILKNKIEEKGYIIIGDRRKIITEKIKLVVDELLSNEDRPQVNYSTYIANKLFLNYTYLAHLFSETEGITIEHHIIEKKIEKAKELLTYSANSISDIANELHYSSIGHFSNQFKKVTGISPTDYRKNQ